MQASEERQAQVESISDGPFRHVNLRVQQMRLRPDFSPRDESEQQLRAMMRDHPAALTCDVSVEVDLRRLPGAKLELSGRLRQTAGVDAQGWLRFADKPQNAPVIHFGGALHMALLVKHSLVSGEKPGDLMTMLGTPGSGPGTFASIPFSGLISNRTHPAAQIEFRAQDGRSEPIKALTVLTHRC